MSILSKIGAFRLSRIGAVFQAHIHHTEGPEPDKKFANHDDLAEMLADLRMAADYLNLDLYKALNDSYHLYLMAKERHQQMSVLVAEAAEN